MDWTEIYSVEPTTRDKQEVKKITTEDDKKMCSEVRLSSTMVGFLNKNTKVESFKDKEETDERK